MSVFITFAAALLIFGAVIAIHEFGHFAVAKLCGVQVNEFSIGMGPTLIKTYRKGTQYTLRLLPVGGFVALEGEESPESEQAEGGSGDDDGPDIPPEVLAQRTGKPLNEAAVWQRMLVMAAGAVMNFVLGFVVLLLLISLRSEPITSKVIYAVEDNALCGQTGLQAGDEIVAVNGRHCFVANDMLYELMRTESCRADFTVRRDGRLVELPDVQFDTWQDEQGQTHMTLGFTVYGLKKTPLYVAKSIRPNSSAKAATVRLPWIFSGTAWPVTASMSRKTIFPPSSAGNGSRFKTPRLMVISTSSSATSSQP